MSNTVRDAILEHVRAASSAAQGSALADWEYLEKHGLELYDGEEDLSLFSVYEDYTNKGKLNTKGEIVIPGRRTLREHPSTAAYGIHFRKTYDPSAPPMKRGETPAKEFAQTRAILDQLPANQRDYVAPLGFSDTVYRSRFIPGRTIEAVSPVADMSYEDAISVPRDEDALMVHAGVVRQLYAATTGMHERGLAHGDLHLGNAMVLPDGHVQLVDFAASADLDDDNRRDLIEDDLSEILREAALVQGALWRRLEGEVFERSLAEADVLFPEDIAKRLGSLGPITPSLGSLAETLRTTSPDPALQSQG